MNVIEIKGRREAPRAERSSMETLIITLDQVDSWKVPPFQRPLHINAKIQKLAEDIKRGECIPGVVTLGQLGKHGDLYIVDAQHRLEGFKMSGLTEVIADVRIVHFDSMADMSQEFVQLNSALVRMRPDDLLRALESSTRSLKRVKSECSWIGYNQIRRGDNHNPILGMSVVIKCWCASMAETPVTHLSGRSVAQAAADMDATETDHLLRWLHLAYAAWGRDPEHFRLWQALNLTLCMWLYRRVVIDKVRGVKRFVVLNDEQYRQCLMTLSASRTYLDYLIGRGLNERGRSPTYARIRELFLKRLRSEGIPRPLLPGPAWYSG